MHKQHENPCIKFIAQSPSHRGPFNSIVSRPEISECYWRLTSARFGFLTQMHPFDPHLSPLRLVRVSVYCKELSLRLLYHLWYRPFQLSSVYGNGSDSFPRRRSRNQPEENRVPGPRIRSRLVWLTATASSPMHDGSLCQTLKSSRIYQPTFYCSIFVRGPQ